MFKPARMTRVLIGGHKSRMADVIEVLHRERALHIEDYRDPTKLTSIGTPLDEGEEASELLVRVRGMLRALDAEDVEGKELTTADAAMLVADAEAELAPVAAEAAQLRATLAALEAERRHLGPFIGIDVELGVLTGLRSVQGYMGTVKQDPRPALDAAGIAYDAGLRESALVLAVARADRDRADRILADVGFTAVAVPDDAEGTPQRYVRSLEARHARAEERLERAEQRIAAHREQWGPRLAALEGHLAALVEKTQAPLQFAVTGSTFHAEGWIPQSRVNRVENALAARFGDAVYFEDLGDAPRGGEHATTGAHELHGNHGEAHHADPKDEAPIKLENKGPAKPFEFMLGLLGRPRYQEIDPTKLMFIFFPLFFGLMVGDFLVGLAIIAFGAYLKRHHIFGIGGPSVGRALVMGGVMATLVGLFVFGEALGIHFVVSDEALEDGEMSWEAVIYGKEEVLHGDAGFPHSGFLHKVEGHGGGHGELVGDGVHNETADGGGNDTIPDPADADPLHAHPDTLDAALVAGDDGHAGQGGHGAHDDAASGEGAHDGASHDATHDATHDGAHDATHGGFAVMAEETEEHGGGPLDILKPHGGAHLNAGPVQLGFYSKIHDIQALLAWSILIAFVHLNLAFLIGIRNVAVGHGWTLAIQEKASWITLQLGAALAIWAKLTHGPSWAVAAGVGIVVLSIGLLWVGVQKALGAPGFVAVLEVLGFAGNILSYTRLAAIGASKAGMALAFAAIGFEVVGGGDIQSIAGWIVYLIGMVVITLLAILSGGLQSLRLQFVEFFQKFYEGGGRPYVPFGRRAP